MPFSTFVHLSPHAESVDVDVKYSLNASHKMLIDLTFMLQLPAPHRKAINILGINYS